MPLDVVKDQNGLQRVILSEPGGSSVEVLLRGGLVVSWKNERGEELLFVRSKNTVRSSPTAMLGGICVCFPQAGSLGPSEQHEYAQHRVWSLETGRPPNGSQSSVDLLLESSDKESKMWPCRYLSASFDHSQHGIYIRDLIKNAYTIPCRFETRLSISVSPGKLTLMPSVRNTSNKSISFTFAMRNYLSVSDISEVRIEGLETLDYLDNAMHKWRFTEQADALTFDGQVNRTYLKTPSDYRPREEENVCVVQTRPS